MNDSVSSTGSGYYSTWTRGSGFSGSTEYYPVANVHKSSTRYENAKSALGQFIEDQKNNAKNSITVINFNDNSTAKKENIVELDDTGYKVERKNNKYYINDSEISGNMYSSKITGAEDAQYFRMYNTKDNKKYVQATDGLWYTFTVKESTQGARVVGTTTDGTSKTNLQKAVEAMTIGDSRNQFRTYISPAYSLVKDYTVKDKKNIVIVLADGEFNDGSYDTSERALGVDEIYCISYGDAFNTSNLEKIATNGECLDAKNTAELIKRFNEIEASATGISEKNKKTNKGVITLKEASDTIKVSKDCPILVTYDSGEKDENGNTIYNELFRCESNNKQTLEKYGLSIQGKVITWDAKKYINNYMEENPDDTDKVVPSEVFIRYYIPRTNS